MLVAFATNVCNNRRFETAVIWQTARGTGMVTGGKILRVLRENRGSTMRDIEAASERFAHRRGNDEYLIPISGLSDFETKGVIPSIYRLYSLAIIYRRDFRELLAWYGVKLDSAAADLLIFAPPQSHLFHALARNQGVPMPVPKCTQFY